MELADWYINSRPDRKFQTVIKQEFPVMLTQETSVEIKLGHEVGELHQVLLNGSIPIKAQLIGWSTGTIQFKLPHSIQELALWEVMAEWS